MTVSLGVIYALIAMFCFGVGDALIKVIVKRVGVYSGSFYRSVFITFFLFLFSSFYLDTLIPPLNTFLIILVISTIGAIAYFAYCKAMEIGHVSVVSPVAHGFVFITVILAMIFYKETITLLQIFSIIIIIAGVIGVSFKYSRLKRLHFRDVQKEIPFALITLVGWGVVFFLLPIPIKQVGPILATLWFEGLLVPLLAIPMLWKEYPLPQKKDIPWFFLIAAFSTVAALAFSFGLEIGPVSIVAPIESSAPLAALLVSYLFLKERLDLNQKISVAMIIAGIIMISL